MKSTIYKPLALQCAQRQQFLLPIFSWHIIIKTPILRIAVAHIYSEVVVNSTHDRNVNLFGVFLSWIIRIFFLSGAAAVLDS